LLHNISTGCKSIDTILQGGLPTESITLIYGEAETGKSTLAMKCAVNCGLQGCKTLYVDCDGTFSAKRLSQIAASNFEQISKLIILMRPNNFQEQSMIVDSLADYIAGNFGLVVFDSVTSLYRVRVADSPEKTFDINRDLNKQLATLAQVAKAQKIVILMVSQVRTVFEKEHVSIEPVATRVVKFWADTVIDMKLTENAAVIKAVLEKVGRKPSSAECYLRIEPSGINEYSLH
jgi:DNA repair protein RadB